ncbi:MAG: LysE family translocator [Rhodobacteraceae bacterium]|nr:LysE family translocator [Paracoccaceae bacterium]
MTFDLWLAFAAFAVVSAITPGPNNMLLLASGLNLGLRRSLPFLAGISAGFSIMLAGVGLGLGAVFRAAPALYEALRWAGAAYLLWLAWKLARAGAGGGRGEVPHWLGFWTGAGFQAVNPKAWVMAVTAIAVYLPPGGAGPALGLIIVTYILLGVPSNLVWVAGGVALRRLLDDPARMRRVNLFMAALLALSVVPVLA